MNGQSRCRIVYDENPRKTGLSINACLHYSMCTYSAYECCPVLLKKHLPDHVVYFYNTYSTYTYPIIPLYHTPYMNLYTQTYLLLTHKNPHPATSKLLVFELNLAVLANWFKTPTSAAKNSWEVSPKQLGGNSLGCVSPVF